VILAALALLAETRRIAFARKRCGLTQMGTYVRMRTYTYTLTEHDADRPWLVVGHEHRSVELEDVTNFFEWAHRAWPAPRFTVQLDPYQELGSKGD
jgi:hypothetical protein